MSDRIDTEEKPFDFDLGPPDSDPVVVPETDRSGDAPAIPLRPDEGLDKYARVELLKQEREIAAKYHGGPMWGYVVAAFIGFAVWVAMFPLTMFGVVHPLIALVVSTFITVAGYVTCHEAMHDNIAKRGSKDRWMNQWVGEVSLIPIAVPFSMGKVTHLEHHKHCNDPDNDPDYTDEAPNIWAAWYKTWWNRQPRVDGTINRYKRACENLGTPEANKALKQTVYVQLFYLATLFTMAWNGYAIAAAVCWWLPRQLGLSWIRFFLSWAPHHPREGHTGRYDQAYIFKSRIGHFFSMCMETHLIHHLYPGIPNHRTKAAYQEMKPVLEKRGVDCSAL
ncbi:fatty acid desaturase [Erythrobacter litoralis]|uniref:Beta-carotene hydroxylase n=1 Tax=Erythrobacter litoralis (strain HTCC2594) TaxID=314225 RepID=Q2NCI3_ERYLH|nr:fatty acid desaturase [Erythrobacter litoralis]ABC62608.1 beta-carotene hydroxylase [Erythrobacter litoralis HTCC2594]